MPMSIAKRAYPNYRHAVNKETGMNRWMRGSAAIVSKFLEK